MTDQIIDSIPLEDEFQFSGPDGAGQCVAMFYAFNTVITLQAYAEADVCRAAFSQAKDACRAFERHLSRTLPHSDIARLNDAQGAWVAIAPDTYELLAASKRYCAESGGIFDITMGSAVRLWNFHEGIMPNGDELAQALTHVDWRAVELREESSDEGDTSNGKRFFARLTDPQASVDVGGTAKGYIADALGDILQAAGVESFIVNLGGNVLAHGTKPNGNPWMIGLQDPRESRESGKVLGAVPLLNASAVTSGTYERAFERDGVTYHHILDPKTGYPVQTDIAGATVVARTSMDAEGYSTTLLALGKAGAAKFVAAHPAIQAAYLADANGEVTAIARQQ